MEKFTREFIENNRVTVMCDYHYDDLWIDDGPVNIKMVVEARD
jgi:arabinogalactan endo-1,4-beta-galactosidase